MVPWRLLAQKGLVLRTWSSSTHLCDLLGRRQIRRHSGSITMNGWLICGTGIFGSLRGSQNGPLPHATMESMLYGESNASLVPICMESSHESNVLVWTTVDTHRLWSTKGIALILRPRVMRSGNCHLFCLERSVKVLPASPRIPI